MKAFWATAVVDAPAEALWALLIEPDRWPRWGPSIRSAAVDDGPLALGSRGTIRTVLGLTLPFEVTAFEPKRHWAWKVAGVPATGHTVERLGPGQCRVGFSVPAPAAPYLAVCRIALRRLDAIATGGDAS